MMDCASLRGLDPMFALPWPHEASAAALYRQRHDNRAALQLAHSP